MNRKLPHLVFALALPGFAAFFLQALFVGVAALAQEVPVDGHWDCSNEGLRHHGFRDPITAVGYPCEPACPGVNIDWTVEPRNLWRCPLAAGWRTSTEAYLASCEKQAEAANETPRCYPPGWNFGEDSCEGNQVLTDGGFCVPPEALNDARKCEKRGWLVLNQYGSVFCHVGSRSAAFQSESDFCLLFPIVQIQYAPKCSVPFGDELSFPERTTSEVPRFVYNCGRSETGEIVPETINTIGLTECGCANPAEYPSNGRCIPRAGDLPETEKTCLAFRGEVQTTPSGGKICSGVDINDTFCVLGSKVALPCQGFFKHVRACNLDYNRPALDPWHCAGRPLESYRRAIGAQTCGHNPRNCNRLPRQAR